MEDLISKWKKTVENHKGKIDNIRQSSVGSQRNSSRKPFRPAFKQTSKSPTASRKQEGAIKVSQLMGSSINLRASKGSMKRSSLSRSSGSASSFKRTGVQSLKKSQKENTSPSPARSAPDESSNSHVKFFIDNVLNKVFPDSKLKTKKQRAIRDLVEKTPQVGAHLAALKRINKDSTNLEYDLKMGQTENEDISKQISNLERSHQKTSVEVHSLEQEIEELELRLTHLNSAGTSSIAMPGSVYEQALNQLTESQADLKQTNNGLKTELEEERKRHQRVLQMWQAEKGELEQSLNAIQQF